jgi:hypothetical protein
MKRGLLALSGLLGLSIPVSAHAAGTSLIDTDFFTGIQADLLTAVVGILGLALLIFGLVILMRVIGR